MKDEKTRVPKRNALRPRHFFPGFLGDMALAIFEGSRGFQPTE
jgi:hypothetical protein